MSRRRILIEEVLVHLGAERGGFLEAMRREGLFLQEELEPGEAEDLRVARMLFEELGVNAAGVDVALHLRRRLLALEERARWMAETIERLDPKPRGG